MGLIVVPAVGFGLGVSGGDISYGRCMLVDWIAAVYCAAMVASSNFLFRCLTSKETIARNMITPRDKPITFVGFDQKKCFSRGCLMVNVCTVSPEFFTLMVDSYRVFP